MTRAFASGMGAAFMFVLGFAALLAGIAYAARTQIRRVQEVKRHADAVTAFVNFAKRSRPPTGGDPS